MLKQKNNKILLYGGKSTAYIVNSMLKNTKLEPSYIFDQYLKEPFFHLRQNSQIKKSI